MAHLLTVRLTEYFKPAVKTHCSEKKKNPLKIFLLIYNASSHTKSSSEDVQGRECYLYACQHNIHFVACESSSNIDFQVLLFKEYILLSITATDNDSSDGPKQNKFKTSKKILSF